MSVYKRGGVYWFDFWFQGQRLRESTGLTNKTSALRVEAIREAELAEGRAGIRSNKPCPTFEKFVSAEFMPWSENEHRSHPKTHQRYKVSSKPLIGFFGRFRLDAISAGLVERFKSARSNEISDAGTNRDLAALRLILNLAVREGYLMRNPVSQVRFLCEGPGSMRIVSHEEQRQYMKAANPLVRDVATIIVETGMRPEEVYAIRRENVFLSRKYLLIPNGKTRFARRNVPLNDTMLAILERRMKAAKGSYLFPHRLDSEKPLTTAHRGHQIALTNAGMKAAFRLYDFRHTFGSRSAMAGVDLPTLKELMGHSTITMTMRYVHPTPEHKREAVLKLERFNVEQNFEAFEPSPVPTKVPTVDRRVGELAIANH
jgi:integrase